MRRPLCTFALALVLALPAAAFAGRNDLQIYRLGNPKLPGSEANARFRLLMVDLGMAATPTPGHPAETLGRLGASIEIGARSAQIHPDARIDDGNCPTLNQACKVWVNEGSHPGRASIESADPYLAMPMVHVRKGLPFSFEFDSKVQYIAFSEMYAASAGFRWALNEGWDFLPDVSVGGQGTRLLGNRDFGLTTAALDVMIGKWFGVGGMVVITPYAGWQRIWVSGVSEVIDFDPGNEDPANPTDDDTIFDEVLMGENAYDRFFLGVRVNSYLLQFLGEATYTPGYLGQDAALAFMAKLGIDF
ncbi:MAG: hypothetical protein D6729_09080 [Deltaproteobacteria bacterium]|nr:MAG: hypothetical protein D6729_09080 [Deltaproteobacteria bacterium]